LLSLSEKNRVSETVIAMFKMFYVDTVQAWKPALQCASEFFGAGHLVFGSDFPWGPEGGERYIQNSLAAVEALDVTLEERQRILADNARALFGVASPC
jgi:aminocarboxymuconate-semialdehyde decarboxylase